MTASVRVPPLATAGLPGVGGHIGPLPEDFVVDEVPLYAASGTGEHLYVRMEKRDRTTRDVVRAVAEAAGAAVSEVGTAGMKDKHAVTTQWLSVPARRASAPDTWQLPAGMRVLEVARHGNRLRTGHLRGNSFRIRIVGTVPDAEKMGREVLAFILAHGLPNYFGTQRFGRGGRNLSLALDWLAGARNAPPFERKLYSSVVQAEGFNRYLTARAALGFEHPLEGEVVRLDGTGSHFAIDDPAREGPRWAARDIHPTGPMFGPKAKSATGRALVLEEEAVLTLGLSPDQRQMLARFADGTRRDLLVWPEALELAGDGEGSVVVSFFLPAGSFATQVVRELTREAFEGD